jgi:hypothetical protein
MGLSRERQFQTFHRVLNRDRWSSRQLSCILLRVLVQTFVPTDQPLVLGRILVYSDSDLPTAYGLAKPILS